MSALLPSTDLVEQLNQAAQPERLAEIPKAEAWHFNQTRPAPPPPPATVPMASWWSNQEVEMAPGRWCREPPPYSLPKPALPTRSPPFDEKPLLSVEMARQHASPDNMLIVTYVNKNRLDFALTWVRHLLAANQPHFLVGALDAEALRGLEERGVPCYLIDYSKLAGTDTGWGTQAFRMLGLYKVQMVLALARTGVDTLTVDADAFLVRDPLPYFRALPQADVLMSSDQLSATRGYADQGLEGEGAFGSAFNIGYIFIRASAVEFVQEWRDKCYSEQGSWDQNLFASTLRRAGELKHEELQLTPERLRPMYRTKSGRHLLAGILPVSLFASGHTFFVTRMAHLMHTQPYMVHTTFQYGGVQGKRHRLREGMVWEDADEYYTQPFLRFDIDLPHHLVYPHGSADADAAGTLDFGQRHTVAEHFALVHHQLSQIRNGLALAQALGRILSD